ncbi:hypothetical protein GTQ43_20885 [Nostoc sp. KVJ3]|uniref:hypothetical protein n=1 Tax=Nostoc sp. KVJ3 TaxID=457945 RepID=UPI002237CEF6|nr:hypothetical protein [Nostoc sp. KVJ3]MCW5315619.1 hypothetical protein [Nostoc sp. KVJ3]MCW5316181.1 hypothetical protein [Nostoc sp. KVJ3]
MQRYRDIQNALKNLRTQGATLQCRLDSDYSILKSELERLEACVVVDANSPSIQPVRFNTSGITVSDVNETTVTCGINGEYRILPCYWDHERDTAITKHKEVVILQNSSDISSNSPVLRDKDMCKIEIIGDEKGSYQAFPMTSLQGYAQWLYPTEATKYYTIKAKLSPYDTKSYQIVVDKDRQTPMHVVSQDVCVCTLYDDVKCGITRYFPSIAQFTYIGGKWLYSNRHGDIQWISIIQAVKKVHFPVGCIVHLQSDIGLVGKIDTYRIDKLFYSGLLLMAHCTNERTNNVQIIPLVQLHLPRQR